MQKQMVLVIDKDSRHAEGLLFVLRLAGYDSCLFLEINTALNWGKQIDDSGDVLCLLVNDLDQPNDITAAITTLKQSRTSVPTILVQRGKHAGSALAQLVDNDDILVCEPANVMNTLEILAAVQYAVPPAETGLAATP